MLPIIVKELFFFLAVAVAQQDRMKPSEALKWSRWEERTIDCTSPGLPPEQCRLIATNSKIVRDPAKYRCRSEPMIQRDWNHLARNSTVRIACPIGCEPNADLSVLVKTPRNNPLCQKYYTYGKYRDETENEWYLWFTEPCKTNITTWCRFQDALEGARKRKH